MYSHPSATSFPASNLTLKANPYSNGHMLRGGMFLPHPCLWRRRGRPGHCFHFPTRHSPPGACPHTVLLPMVVFCSQSSAPDPQPAMLLQTAPCFLASSKPVDCLPYQVVDALLRQSFVQNSCHFWIWAVSNSQFPALIVLVQGAVQQVRVTLVVCVVRASSSNPLASRGPVQDCCSGQPAAHFLRLSGMEMEGNILLPQWISL